MFRSGSPRCEMRPQLLAQNGCCNVQFFPLIKPHNSGAWRRYQG